MCIRDRFTSALIKADVINAVLSLSSTETHCMDEVNICTFHTMDRLRLTIRIAFIISSYINVNLLYLIVAYTK